MDTQFQKAYYPNPCGFSLHHTCGFSAEDSTLSYLHRNAAVLLICFLQGRGHVIVEDSHYAVGPGDVILLHPGELYRCSIDGTDYHERMVIHIGEDAQKKLPVGSDALLRPLYTRSKGVGNHIPAALVRQAGADCLLEQLLHHCRLRQPVENVLAVCKLLELLAELGRLTLSDQRAEPDFSEKNPLLDEVVRYVHAHLREDITLDSIAAACNIHKSYLSHLFKDYMGTSVWNYVILRRLYLFNSLLQPGDSVEQTCYAVGFQNYANFFRLYKKHMGITPLQYKKQLLGAGA